MDIITSLLAAVLDIVNLVLDLYMILIAAWIIIGWLTVFNVVNPHNRFIQVVNDLANRLTAPLLRPLRRFVPVIGGIDLSPLVLILAIMFLQSFIGHLAVKL